MSLKIKCKLPKLGLNINSYQSEMAALFWCFVFYVK